MRQQGKVTKVSGSNQYIYNTNNLKEVNVPKAPRNFAPFWLWASNIINIKHNLEVINNEAPRNFAPFWLWASKYHHQLYQAMAIGGYLPNPLRDPEL